MIDAWNDEPPKPMCVVHIVGTAHNGTAIDEWRHFKTIGTARGTLNNKWYFYTKASFEAQLYQLDFKNLRICPLERVIRNANQDQNYI